MELSVRVCSSPRLSSLCARHPPLQQLLRLTPVWVQFVYYKPQFSSHCGVTEDNSTATLRMDIFVAWDGENRRAFALQNLPRGCCLITCTVRGNIAATYPCQADSCWNLVRNVFPVDMANSRARDVLHTTPTHPYLWNSRDGFTLGYMEKKRRKTFKLWKSLTQIFFLTLKYTLSEISPLLAFVSNPITTWLEPCKPWFSASTIKPNG